MSVLSLSYQESDATITNIYQSLPQHHGGKTAGMDMVWRKYVTVILCIGLHTIVTQQDLRYGLFVSFIHCKSLYLDVMHCLWTYIRSLYYTVVDNALFETVAAIWTRQFF